MQVGEPTYALEQVLVDIGAGNGYFSLAAAARGHRAIAFELSNSSLASFEASVAYNGFEKMVTIHKVLLRRLSAVLRSIYPPQCLELVTFLRVNNS